MTREATILAKHEDLKKCIQTRTSLLLDLYRSTTILSNIKCQPVDPSSSLNIDLAGEKAFLDANDLSIGRYFHPSTLPPLSPKPSQVGNHSPSHVVEANTLHSVEAPSAAFATVDEHAQQGANTIGDRRLGLEPVTQDNTSPTTSSKPTNIFPCPEPSQTHQIRSGLEQDDAKQDDVAEGRTPPSNHVASSEPQTVSTLETLPPLPEESTKLSTSITERPEGQSTSGGARTVHIPPKEKQGERLENLEPTNSYDDAQSPPRPDPVDGYSAAQSSSRLAPENVSQSQGHVEPKLSATQPAPNGAPEAEGDGVLKPQLEIAPSDAATGGSPFSPDEQLRLEEARSTQWENPDKRTGLSARHSPDSAVAQDTSSALSQLDKHTESTAQIPNVEVRPVGNFRYRQVDAVEPSPVSALRSHAYTGFAGGDAKDITFSQRPPMRIDTELSQIDSSKTSYFKKPLESTAASTHTPPDSATSTRASQSSAQAQSPPERMTTRVSSGALRHKSVSEILGETPKPTTPHTDRALNERTTSDINRGAAGLQSPRSSGSLTSPDPATFRLRLNELKDKDRSKLSTVIFARKQPLQSARRSENLRPREADAVEAKTKNTEYFYPLIHAQSASPPRAQLLNRLIGSASKTLTTSNHYVDYHEQQDCRILSRIEQLQKANGWSLRQLERSAEPERPLVHWDVLLSQMRWLRTDFREERKWKLAAASSLASWCAQWVVSSKEERIALQVPTRPRRPPRTGASDSFSPPDLIPSAEDDSSDAADDDIDNVDVFPEEAPAAIFSMAPEMFYFGLEKTASAEKLLQELPLYQPSTEIQQAALNHDRIPSDKEWKPALLPVSRFAEGKIVSHEEGPPRKRSRYDYSGSDEDDHFPSTGASVTGDETLEPRPEQDDVALFNPENKHIRDRIHAGHAFRPPSEHVMPSQSFFESRHSSQWTQPEDDELRRLVREFAYNWSLISSCLSVPSAFSSGAERRTPWECFERWIGLEGLPAEMAKTQYFRAYHARLQAAQTTHEAQQQLLQQQQQQQGGNASHMPPRRRSTQPVQVERRRNTKHVHLVNAMKNLARKREAVPKKAEKADSSAVRKAASATQPRHAMQTPQEFSRLRHERDVKLQEQAKVYRMQMMQQQKIHAAQRSGASSGQQPNGASMPQAARANLQALPNGNGAPNLLPNGQVQQSMNNQPRPPQMPRPTNGVQSNAPFPANQPGVPHAPMQAAPMPGSGSGAARVPPQMGSDSMRVFHEATRVQAEQQRFLQQQRQQQHPQMNGQLSPNLTNTNLMPPNPSSAHPNFQRRSGSPSANGAPTPNGSSTSPRMTNPSQPQALSSGMMPTINQMMSQARARNPNATPEQISQMATDRLKQFHAHAHTHNHAHAAMQAASGANVNATAMNANGIGSLQAPSQQQPPTAMMSSSSTQQYAQMMASQRHQQSRGSGTSFSGGQRPSSRGDTPQLHRTPSAQGLHPSLSPVPSQSQVAGAQGP